MIAPFSDTLLSSLIPKQAEYLKKKAKLRIMNHAICLVGDACRLQNAVALYLLNLVVCEKKEACRSCEGCRMLLQNTHPDVAMINPDLTMRIGVEDALRLRQSLAHRPVVLKNRIGVILDADRFTTAATNAILKLIEEPPTPTFFILTTNHPRLIPATLRSRCQILHIPHIEKENAWKETEVSWITFLSGDVAKKEAALRTTFHDKADRQEMHQAMVSALEALMKIFFELWRIRRNQSNMTPELAPIANKYTESQLFRHLTTLFQLQKMERDHATMTMMIDYLLTL